MDNQINNDKKQDAAGDSPFTDSISPRAKQIARAIDRLLNGYDYIIFLTKPDIDAANWKIEVIRAESLQKMALTKKD